MDGQIRMGQKFPDSVQFPCKVNGSVSFRGTPPGENFPGFGRHPTDPFFSYHRGDQMHWPTGKEYRELFSQRRKTPGLNFHNGAVVQDGVGGHAPNFSFMKRCVRLIKQLENGMKPLFSRCADPQLRRGLCQSTLPGLFKKRVMFCLHKILLFLFLVGNPFL